MRVGIPEGVACILELGDELPGAALEGPSMGNHAVADAGQAAARRARRASYT